MTVRTARNIDVAATARLSAKSALGNGGNVILFAGEKLTVKSGASFDVSSTEKDAGLVEFSARRAFDLGDRNLNLRAPKGIGGTLLLDPDFLVIGGFSGGANEGLNADPSNIGVTMLNSQVNTAIGLAYVAGASKIIFEAGNSITIAANGVLDTRQFVDGFSSRNALDIEIKAPNYQRDVRRADFRAGHLEYDGCWRDHLHQRQRYADGYQDPRLSVGSRHANTFIIVDGQITGGNITIGATSTAHRASRAPRLPTWRLSASRLRHVAGTERRLVAADASATVQIKSNARITGSGNVDITAKATQDAQTPVIAACRRVAADRSRGGGWCQWKRGGDQHR